MKKSLGILFLLLTLVLISGRALAEPNDPPGSSDPPLFTRMPGYFIEGYEEKDFDASEFVVAADDKKVTVEGHFVSIRYATNDRSKSASALAIRRNYANALQKLGGKVVYQDNGRVTLQLIRNGAEVWAQVEPAGDGNVYFLVVVQKEAMKQDVVADAASLASSLKDTGKVALYGVYFDTGKAELKPESEPSLNEIARLLQADPKLALCVVGHTDNVGGLEYNLKLSKDRADAVIKALVSKYGVAAARLKGFGVGPLAPVAPNQNEEGRALNRRVELVAQ